MFLVAEVGAGVRTNLPYAISLGSLAVIGLLGFGAAFRLPSTAKPPIVAASHNILASPF